mgnify:CR=1 FL=1
MVRKNNETFEILGRRNTEAFRILSDALTEGRIIIRDGDKKWNARMAAKAIMGCVTAYSTLWREAKMLEIGTTGRWDPKSTRAVLGARRKIWNRQRS